LGTLECPDFGERVKSTGLDDEIADRAIGSNHQ